MNKMNKIVMVICKVNELIFWMLDALMVICAVLSIALGQSLTTWVGQLVDDGNLSIEGMDFAIDSFDGLSQGRINATFFLIFLSAAVTSSLAAMIFRNVYLIFRTSEGMTKYSKGATPFQPENVRMVREIGIFAIAIPIVQVTFSILISIASATSGNVMVDFTSVIFGFIILCLSRYFTYGVELQDEVDGLL